GGRQQRQNRQVVQDAGNFKTQGDRVGTGQRKVEQHQLRPVDDRRQAALACLRVFQFVREPRQQRGGSGTCLPVADYQNAGRFTSNHGHVRLTILLRKSRTALATPTLLYYERKKRSLERKRP